jgi:hypothetical protein
MQLTAINKAHQSKMNKATKWLAKYNELNNQRDNADDNGDEKLYKKFDRLCANAFDKYLDIVTELPKRERLLIEKSELY